MTRHDVAQWPPTGRPDLRSFVPRERRLAPLLLWLACLAAALGLLLWLGDGRLATPDLTAPSTWGDWVRDRGTAEAVIAVLRIVALGLAWYLVGVTTVSVLAHAARVARLVRVADALSFGPVRTVVQQALGVGLAVGVVASALPPGASGATGPVATATASAIVDDDRGIGQPIAPGGRTAAGSAHLDDPVVAGAPVGDTVPPDQPIATAPASGAAPPVPAPDDGGHRLVARPLDEDSAATAHGDTAASAGASDDPSSPTSAPRAPAGPAVAAGGVVDAGGERVAGRRDRAAVADDRVVAGEEVAAGGWAAAPAGSAAASDVSVDDAGTPTEQPGVGTGTAVEGGTSQEVRVEPGDHLWGLAEEQLRDELGRQPSEREILLHWERVIARNTDRLVVPSNPDLLRPGQRIVLPAVEPGG